MIGWCSSHEHHRFMSLDHDPWAVAALDNRGWSKRLPVRQWRYFKSPAHWLHLYVDTSSCLLTFYLFLYSMHCTFVSGGLAWSLAWPRCMIFVQFGLSHSVWPAAFWHAIDPESQSRSARESRESEPCSGNGGWYGEVHLNCVIRFSLVRFCWETVLAPLGGFPKILWLWYFQTSYLRCKYWSLYNRDYNGLDLNSLRQTCTERFWFCVEHLSEVEEWLCMLRLVPHSEPNFTINLIHSSISCLIYLSNLFKVAVLKKSDERLRTLPLIGREHSLFEL